MAQDLGQGGLRAQHAKWGQRVAHERAAIEAAILADIEQAKQGNCACGQKGTALVHRPGERRLFAIHEATRDLPGLDVLRAELAKCDLMCMGCCRAHNLRRGI